MNNKIVVGIGELLWDVFPERKVLGGAPANFAYHISQFGYNGYAMSAVGEDLLGKEILNNLESKKLNYLLETTDYPTGTVKVTLNSGGIPEYEILENVAWDNIPFSARAQNLAKSTDAVCFGSLAQRNEISRNTIKSFLELMPKDSLKIFDINLRQNFYTKDVIQDSMEKANIMKLNDDELVLLSSLFGWKGTEEEICKIILKQFNFKALVFTKGINGSFIFTPEVTSFQPTPKVHVTDTVGAGDSFTAAFIAAYMYGERLEDAHQLAAEVSAYVCQQHGAMPKLPDVHRELFR